VFVKRKANLFRNKICQTQATGIWKVKFVQSGDYKISLRLFLRESVLPIIATFPADVKTRRIAEPAPAAVKAEFE